MLRAPSWTAGVGAEESDDDDDDSSPCINKVSNLSSNQTTAKDGTCAKTAAGHKNGGNKNYISRLFSSRSHANVDATNPGSSSGLTNSRGRNSTTSNRHNNSNKRSQSCNRQSSKKEIKNRIDARPSIQITVPTAFLATKDASSYHVYQIFIQTKEKEWNVYRRYSQFHALHVSLKKNHSYVAKLDFPPKERINNKTSNTVQLRRKRLEDYLIALVDYIDDAERLIDSDSKRDIKEKFNNFILVGSRYEIDTSSPISGSVQQSTMTDIYSLQASLS